MKKKSPIYIGLFFAICKIHHIRYKLALIRVPSHIHQLKNSELPQNEKMHFLLQVNTQFRSEGTKKFSLIVIG
ncbi:hypothetical protein B7P25_13770 [Bacillus thuringiensis]|nr:hypothetical protein B7P25_13770 [Bacillus thuringiensis]TNO97959.1 hypothetical protein FH038_01150 [Bacillus sp. CD3-1a]